MSKKGAGGQPHARVQIQVVLILLTQQGKLITPAVAVSRGLQRLVTADEFECLLVTNHLNAEGAILQPSRTLYR